MFVLVETVGSGPRIVLVHGSVGNARTTWAQQAALAESFTLVYVTRGGYPPAITVWQAPVPNDGQRPLPPNLQQLLDSRTCSYDPDGAGPLPAIPGSQLPWNIFRGIDFLGFQGTIAADR